MRVSIDMVLLSLVLLVVRLIEAFARGDVEMLFAHGENIGTDSG
jgi:hypothetical protein